MEPVFIAIWSIISKVSCFVSTLYLSSKAAGSRSFNFFINSKVRSSISKTSSLIDPVKAKFRALSYKSNLGHKTPGVSNNKRSLSVFIHWLLLVTPGLFPTLVPFLFDKLFIKVDFPTLGMPTTIILIVLLSIFFSALLSNKSFNILLASLYIFFVDLSFVELYSTTLIAWSLKY